MRERAAAGSDRDDMLSAIIGATVHGRPLTMEEQVGATTILFTGGLDTTKAALGNIIVQMAGNPAIEARVRDPEWIKGDLDEFLRLDSPIAFMARTVTKDIELDGCPLHPAIGSRCTTRRRIATLPDSGAPPNSTSSREHNPHAAFGLGPHRCIGLHFARLQIEIGFQELLARVTNIRIPAGESVHTTTGVVQSPEYLPIEFDRWQPSRDPVNDSPSCQ